MLINSMDKDIISLEVQDVNIDYNFKYSYLGVCFTDDEKINTVLGLHEAQEKHYLINLLLFVPQTLTCPTCMSEKFLMPQ